MNNIMENCAKKPEKLLLKKDLFGEVWQIVENGEAAILRDARPAR